MLLSTIQKTVILGLFVLFAGSLTPAEAAETKTETLRSKIDSPLLFTKRGNYRGIHIYDTCYQWHPGGGIYVLENPSDPPEKHRVRPVIDATTKETLGEGMYFDPDLSYDAKKVLFCFKGEPKGSSSIYEIGIDGTGLRRITNPREAYLPDEEGCVKSQYCGRNGALGAAQDLTPAYLPNGKIVFTTMRHNGLVPCNNTGVAILHIMNDDGTDTVPISVNSETEFDPSLMLDGRLLYGRWEYVDKTALTIQSLWTCYPDGTLETALYANNMVLPEAVLDSRQVFSDPQYIISTFAKHNSTPRGAIALIDTQLGKNDPKAIFNFSDPKNPTRDTGEACEPFPISKDLIIFSDKNSNGKNSLFLIKRNADDSLTRELLYTDAKIDCHSPIPVKPRPMPKMRPSQVDRSKDYGFFTIQDIYEGMPEVPRGSITRLRVVEETSRVSPTPGSNIYNQTFPISAALSFACKNYHGEVPVEKDGSAYFRVPSGKMIYFQALDAEGRCVRSMRTFIQAAPGVTRGCIGCHEDKKATFPAQKEPTIAQRKPPALLKDESWGTGPMDYPSMVQPILDKHCVKCHGGEKGFAKGLDLSGGWTEFFNISYENLVSRREVQYKATLVAGVCSMNGTSYYSAQIFPAYEVGSYAAPLGKVIVEGALGHKDRFKLCKAEKELVLAWIDGNAPYSGTWNYTRKGCRLAGWAETKKQLQTVMTEAGCAKCHDKSRFEPDWFNLENPEMSRILRAPMAKDKEDYGQAFCREAKVDSSFRRVRHMSTGRYEHAVKTLDRFPVQKWQMWDKGPDSGKPVVSFANKEDATYKKMLAIIQQGREAALANPRIDLPGGEPLVISGRHRNIFPVRLPKPLPKITGEQIPAGDVVLRWGLTKYTWGLFVDIYRGDKPDFELNDETKIARTELGYYYDSEILPAGTYHYAVVFDNEHAKTEPIRLSVKVVEVEGRVARQLPQPAARPTVVLPAPAGPYPTGKVVTLPPGNSANATTLAGKTLKASLRGGAKFAGGVLTTGAKGYLSYGRVPNANLQPGKSFVMEFDLKVNKMTKMPVLVSAGQWKQSGWFLQILGGKWRWHTGGVDCDGGAPPKLGDWTHLRCTWDGKNATIEQDGKVVAKKPCSSVKPWGGELFVGQYSGGVRPDYQFNGEIKNLKITTGK